MRVAFLGPEGTFSSEAARRAAAVADWLPRPTIPDVVADVRSGAVDLGVVPIENSIEGSVNLTLDELAFGPPGALIRGEIALPITMSLLARPGTALADVREVRSHAVAIAQCRQWLEEHLPDAELTPSASTASAAREAAALEGVAALGTTHAADLFGLAVLAPRVHDFDGNATRFFVLGRRMHAATGADKTSLVVFFGEDRPGLLMRVLDEFALRNINLTKIESRPTKQQLGEYCIFIDAAAHPTEARMAEALRSVHRHVAELRILGAYPRADLVREAAAGPDSEEAYADAVRWFDGILDAIDDHED